MGIALDAMATQCLSSMTDAHLVYLGLGSNLGDKEARLREAIEHIGKLVGTVERQSAFYFNAPWGFESDNEFVNAVVACSTTLSPRQLLSTTQRIERMMGRKKKSKGGVYHDRVIDIDILLYDNLQVDEPDLKIPHPLMWEREFVTIPLAEVMTTVKELPDDRQ